MIFNETKGAQWLVGLLKHKLRECHSLEFEARLNGDLLKKEILANARTKLSSQLKNTINETKRSSYEYDFNRVPNRNVCS